MTPPRPAPFSATRCPAYRALPGVQHAAGASCLPVPGPCIGTSFWRADLAEASRWPAAIQPGSADHAGFLQDDGDSTSGRPRLLRVRRPGLGARRDRQRGAREAAVSLVRTRSGVAFESTSIAPTARWTSNGRSSASSATPRRRWTRSLGRPSIIPSTQRPGRAMRLFVRTGQDPLVARAAA